MYKWGNTNLLIYRYTYTAPIALSQINEIRILPNADGTPATVLQGGGRERYRWSMDGFTTSYADYQSLLADQQAQTQRTYQGHDSVSITAIIESISPAKRISDMKFEYSISFLEV